jgi:uncharacterized Zn finger protein (UPF0148 family)
MPDLTAHDFQLEVTSREGDRMTYRVTGQITCPTTGYRFELEPTNEGINPSDESAALALRTTEPDGPVVEVITEEVVSGTFDDSAKLRTVGVRLGSVRTKEDRNTLSLTVDS